MSNNIKLEGIMSEGYGIVPKKLMKMNIDKNIKLVLCYMLSYTGAGTTCFPSVKQISKDLHMAPNRVVWSIRKACKMGFIKKEKRFPDKPLKRGNQYTILFLDRTGYENITIDNIDIITIDNLHDIKHDNMYINNNNINNNNNSYIINNNINDSKESLKSVSIEKVFDEKTKDLLKEVVSIGGFKTRFPVNGEQPSKLLMKAKSYIMDFHKGLFDTRNECDSKWVKRNNIEFNFIYDDWECLIKDCKKAARRYKQMREKGYWPENKKILTNSLADWFYNPFTKASWFLYCLYNAPKTIVNKNGEHVGRKVFDFNTEQGKEDYDTCLKILEPKWPEFAFWGKVKKMYEWYNENKSKLKSHNQGIWITECSTFSEFLVNYIEFRDYWRKEGLDWTSGHFGYGNRTWNRFVIWFKENKGIDLEPKEILNIS